MEARSIFERLIRPSLSALLALAILLSASCGGAGSGGNGSSGGGPPPPIIPAITSISPSSATAERAGVGITIHGANFDSAATVQWNGFLIPSTWANSTLMAASVPASDLVSPGSAMLTVTNPTGGNPSPAQIFTILAAPSSTTTARTVSGISNPHDIVWDAARGTLYVSIASLDTVAPNKIVTVNPITGAVGTSVDAGSDPDALSISSDSAYLWAGMDGDNAVQRFALPGLTRDISFPVPLDYGGNPQQPVSLQAAPANPHTVGLVAGHYGYSPVGAGVYVFDDATPRPNSVPGPVPGNGPMIDWLQWGANDSTIYGSQYTTIDAGGVATLNVTSSGVSLASYNGGQIGPTRPEYDRKNSTLYSYGAAFNPANGSLVGTFDVPGASAEACTADSSLGRYYCVVAYGGGLSQCDLWVFDLNTYAILDRIFLGASAGQPTPLITGQPTHMVRWGNAGLAVTSITAIYYGNGGLFLIDGGAVSPTAAPDISTGMPGRPYTWMASMAPSQAPTGNVDVNVTVQGNHFTPNSTACWNCNALQFQFLPTTYVSPQQLSVAIPPSLLTGPATLPIRIFDSGSSLFSTNSLTFTVMPASTSNTKVTPVDLVGLAMAWDPRSALLYVGTADYDGAYPNSIVAVDPGTGSVVKAQTVSPDPDLVSISANGEYLYAGFAGATTLTQLQLPGLTQPLTWTLNNSASSAVFFAGDMKSAPISPHTTAVDLFNTASVPQETGGVVVYDDNVPRPDFVNGWDSGPALPTIYDALAWSASDQILTAVCSFGCLSNTPMSPLYQFQITPSGAAFVAAGPPSFNFSEIHSDFGTGLIYGDDGTVADPRTLAVVGFYNASGLVAPDSTLNRVFVLGQTQAQANTSNFTIASFDQKAFTLVSTITIQNLLGSPFQLVRCGTSGLAVLT
jgi:hypothetical protein